MAKLEDTKSIIYVETTIEYLDDIKDRFKFHYFTVGKGKAKYHYVYLAKNTVGIYYALRSTPSGLCCRRAIKPNTTIKCYIELN